MTLNSSFVVRVEKQPELSFGDIMNRIRTWLDHHKNGADFVCARIQRRSWSWV